MDTVIVHSDKVVPQLVIPGDRVAVVAPGSQLSPQQLASAVELLRSWKLVVVIGKSVMRECGYLSGPDYLRLQDLHDAWSDPLTTAIFCLRGGYGTQRIVDLVDWTVCQHYPKYLVGFSDITALHLALWKNTSTVSLHGPCLGVDAARITARSIESMRSALMLSADTTIPLTPSNPTYTLCNLSEVVEGTLLGGNLSILATTIGTRNWPNMKDSILLIEEVHESPYRVDRMLTYLHRCGAFGEVGAVLLGQFIGCEGAHSEPTVIDVLREAIGRYNIPAIGGLPVGHGVDSHTIPLGCQATIDPERKSVDLRV